VAIARADASEKEGLVAAKVRLADAEAIAKQGAATAEALRLKLEAEASGLHKSGEATAESLRLKLEAEASGKHKYGEAEAHAIAARFAAEAGGLKEKFEAMQTMSAETRAHEEQRMQLDYAHAQRLKSIEANQAIAREQAEVLSKALQASKIEIVGGDGEYFERFMRSLSLGRSIDGTVDRSALLSTALAEHKAGKRDLIADARELIAALGGAEAVRDLSIAGLAQKLTATGRSGDGAA
jgi:hypothetical protein